MLHSILHGFFCIFKFPITRQYYKMSVFIDPVDLLNQFQPGESRHLDISKNDVRVFIEDHIIGFNSIPGCTNQLDSKRIPVNQSGHSFTDNLFVINNQ